MSSIPLYRIEAAIRVLEPVVYWNDDRAGGALLTWLNLRSGLACTLLCLRALGKSPSERYASAAALHDEVQAWLEAESDRGRRRALAEERAREGARKLEEYRKQGESLPSFEELELTLPPEAKAAAQFLVDLLTGG